eukprot:4103766-Prymnesium_polylepis.1
MGGRAGMCRVTQWVGSSKHSDCIKPAQRPSIACLRQTMKKPKGLHSTPRQRWTSCILQE